MPPVTMASSSRQKTPKGVAGNPELNQPDGICGKSGALEAAGDGPCECLIGMDGLAKRAFGSGADESLDEAFKKL